MNVSLTPEIERSWLPSFCPHLLENAFSQAHTVFYLLNLFPHYLDTGREGGMSSTWYCVGAQGTANVSSSELREEQS